MSKTPAERYSVYLNVPPHKRGYIKQFVKVMGYSSVSDFIPQAIEEKIKNDLAKLDPDQRKAIEKVLALGSQHDLA